MADKKSGVYYSLTDNSIRLGGGSGFGGVVPMYTMKGPVGELISVTAQDYRDKLGYDLEYNPGYLGLDTMLASVVRLNVLRMNINPAIGWRAWKRSGSTLTDNDSPGFGGSTPPIFYSVDEIAFEDFDIWVAHKTPGHWGNFGVRFKELESGDYILEYAERKSGDSYYKPNQYYFSLDPAADNYYEKVNFGDLVLGFYQGSDPQAPDPASFPEGFPFYETPPETVVNPPSGYVLIANGDNGFVDGDTIDSKVYVLANDLSQRLVPIDKLSCDNVVVLNNFTQDSFLVKKFVEYCAKQDRSVLIDYPGYVKAQDTSALDAGEAIAWVNENNLLMDGGQYGQVIAGSDLVSDGVKDLAVPPSAYLFQVYAKMYANYGNTNYPPAGFTYGAVTASRLRETNFGSWGDELKTSRINYLTSGSRGVCIWEQRTLYNLGTSDLSYANTVFILRDLKLRIIDFMEGYNFRYTTPIDLLNIQSGLTSILDYFRNSYFLVNYALKVPTYEEAQAAGRNLDIDIKVSVISDAEVITIRVGLENAANLRAA